MTSPLAPAPAPAPLSTADALVVAGIELFGARGFAATSTRELAQAAQANVAAIAYHFGSKEGLREACGRAAARRLAQDALGEAAQKLDAALAAGLTQAQAEAQMLALVRALVRALTPALTARADLDPVVRFILREQTEMSSAFQIVHDAVIAPMHERLCLLWAAATGAAADAQTTRLSTLTFMAQIIYFRIARNVALKRLGWRRIGPKEADAIAEIVAGNLRAALAAAREAAPASGKGAPR